MATCSSVVTTLWVKTLLFGWFSFYTAACSHARKKKILRIKSTLEALLWIGSLLDKCANTSNHIILTSTRLKYKICDFILRMTQVISSKLSPWLKPKRFCVFLWSKLITLWYKGLYNWQLLVVNWLQRVSYWYLLISIKQHFIGMCQ